MSRVGFVTHPRSLDHDAGPGHPERPDRITAVVRHLAACRLDERLDRSLEVAPAPVELLARAHEASYVAELEDLDRAGGGRLDADTRMGAGSFDAARIGSQAVCDAAEHVLDGRWSSAFVCTRPPGHHATASRGMGFCLTNHVAVAARWAIDSRRAERVAILDWDAHHGNGTQDIFYDDPSVLYVSLHQFPWYPGTGDVDERGAGAGTGSTINVPLPAGAAEEAYVLAMEAVVLPGIEAFAPDVLFVSAGFDAHVRDPLCMMRLTAGAFFRLTRMIRGCAAGPVCVLEGGYDLDALSWSAAATLSALLDDGEPVGLPDTELDVLRGEGEAAEWVRRAAAAR